MDTKAIRKEIDGWDDALKSGPLSRAATMGVRLLSVLITALDELETQQSPVLINRACLGCKGDLGLRAYCGECRDQFEAERDAALARVSAWEDIVDAALGCYSRGHEKSDRDRLADACRAFLNPDPPKVK